MFTINQWPFENENKPTAIDLFRQVKNKQYANKRDENGRPTDIYCYPEDHQHAGYRIAFRMNRCKQSVTESILYSIYHVECIDGAVITKYENKIKTKTIWILIKGYTKSRKINLNADRKKGANKHNHDKYSIPNECSKDMETISKEIGDKDDQHVFMTIDIKHENASFGKEGLIIKLAEAYNYACKYGERLIIYYTGHGQQNTGDWILNSTSMTSTSIKSFHDETKNHCPIDNGLVSLEDISESVFTSNRNKEIRILSDCGYSNQWVAKIGKFTDNVILKDSEYEFHVYGSADPKTGRAEDGKFSAWICGKSEVGICHHGKVDKDGGWIGLWVDSKLTDLRSLSGTDLLIDEDNIYLEVKDIGTLFATDNDVQRLSTAQRELHDKMDCQSAGNRDNDGNFFNGFSWVGVLMNKYFYNKS
eukprot:CAMPEP_0201568374 /NCGR_PEP_ID=MMETSP0190_2-20130828/9417_1 /ASSEMBLY_ACC=CAM_ASM_000263 /TAXON_ID=37353 /ORGANISM="Rosalina sp." /LENGTH=418 /DNA_ID=CAMNT_0047989417 /DNA_START=46 /DNA_END=1302 /DNA_ORIENTATION=+